MPYKRIKIFAIVLFFFFSLDGLKLLNAQGNVSSVVKKIEFKGNDRINSSMIKAAIKTNQGDIYDPKAISQDVDAIWLLGFFDNIEVEVEAYEGGVKVIFLVLERPVIRSIFFAGNDAVKTQKLRQGIQIREGDYLKRYLLKLDEDKIREIYQSKGFSHIDIKSEEKKTNGYVNITFKIREGSKIYIKEIVFEGNKTFSSKRLAKIITTKRRKFPRFLFSGKFDKGKIEEDVDKIKAFYGSGGWLDADVKWQEQYSSDKTKMFIHVLIDEGDRYYVDNINIKGNNLFTDNEITGMLELKKGSAFLPESLQKDSQGIRMAYGRQGYLSANVASGYTYKQVEPKIDITFDILENERFFIEKVIVTGNDKTKDNVIRRNLNFFPGERLDTEKIKRSEQVLTGTGYFDSQSGSASEITYVPGTKYNTKNVIVDVKEGRTGMLRFGGGYGANAGLFGDISYTDKNFDIFDWPKDWKDFMSGNAFRGGGHTITLRFSPGIDRTEGMFSFNNPSVYDSGYSLGFTANIFRRDRNYYVEKRQGVKMSFGKTLLGNNILRGLRLGLTPKFENVGVQNVEHDAPIDVKETQGSNLELSLELVAILDRRDSRMFPSKGFKLTSSIKGSVMDVDVVKFQIKGTKYHTIFNFPDWRGKHILSYGGTIGVVQSTSVDDVPIFERFFAGGTGSIRGFQFRGVGPVDRVTGEQVGGEILILGTVEYTMPVYADMLRLAFFVDTAKVDNDEKKDDFGSNSMRASWGFGFRAKVPFMGNSVVSVDFGFPFRDNSTDNETTVTFNFGGR
jgi:outer membrane protein insertion porin family